MRFTDTFSDVLWDPPATAGVLSGLSYIVIVINMNTSEVIVSGPTTNTIYPLPVIKSCQYYTANVTAFSSQHSSNSVVTAQRTPGGEFKKAWSICQLSITIFSEETKLSVLCFSSMQMQRATQ